MVTKRTLLVVEDDDILNIMYTDFCREALEELLGEGVPIEGTVEQARSYSQAKNIIETQTVDFASVDIALSVQEEGLNEEKRKGQEPGGMNLLREMQEAETQPISVVLTGETLQSYALDALRVYRVLAFYQKDRFDADRYKSAVKAALWYLDAAELTAEPGTELDIEAAEANWKRALEVAKVAGIKEQDFPEAMGYKIKSARDGLTHSVTRLPIGRWTEDRLRSEVAGREDWVLIHLTIKGFSRFVATFASQEEAILSFVARLLKRARDKFQDQQIFIGHFGHREHTSEPGFVVIPGKKSIHCAIDIARWIESEFEKKAKVFAPTSFREDEANQQEPALTIETKVLTSIEYTFSDLHDLLDTMGPLQL